MSPAEPTTAGLGERAGTDGRWSGTAFGIDLEAPFAIDGLLATEPGSIEAPTRLELVSREELELAWPSEGAQRRVERRFPDGRLALTIDRHEQVGYRLWWVRAGRYIVGPDGLRVLCSLPRVGAARWQRYVVAQVLPLAAALRGLEVIHASAVSVGDQAVAFVAPSGTGKTTLAAHLVLGGAGFLTDDVLALEARGDAVWGHPGVGVVNLEASDDELVGPGKVSRLGQVVGRSDKAHVALAQEVNPKPLRAVYFLERGLPVDHATVERVSPPDPRLLLASAFLPHLDSPERLVNQLQVCALLSRSSGIYRVRAPAATSAVELAAVLSRHIPDALRRAGHE